MISSARRGKRAEREERTGKRADMDERRETGEERREKREETREQRKERIEKRQYRPRALLLSCLFSSLFSHLSPPVSLLSSLSAFFPLLSYLCAIFPLLSLLLLSQVALRTCHLELCIRPSDPSPIHSTLCLTIPGPKGCAKRLNNDWLLPTSDCALATSD